MAIKQLNPDGLQGNREIIVEVFMLSLFHNLNLVTLIGYCTSGDQRLLVYEYMPMGSLEDHLFGLVPQLPLHYSCYKMFFQVLDSYFLFFSFLFRS